MSLQNVLLLKSEPVSTEVRNVAAKHRWYVLQTHPRKEAYVAMSIEHQKFKSFCPRFRKTVSHARTRREVLAPLFPGYLFVRFDPATDPWWGLKSTHGVWRLISARDHTPFAVPPHVMDDLLARCQNGVFQSLLKEMVPGRTVKIASGPFADKLARIHKLDDEERVAILLEIMGQDQVLTFRPSDLVPV